MAAKRTYQGGALPITGALLGTETVVVGNGGARITTVTTQQIANLSGNDEQAINTAITTVGAGVLTAAGIVGGLITRTGPIGAYTDTTDTAAAIVAAIPNAFVGQSFFVQIKNGTAFTQTIAAGNGVTITGVNLVARNNLVTYLVTLTSLTAVGFQHVSSVEISSSLPAAQFNTAVVTVGTLAAGILTGANMCYFTSTGATPGAQTVRTAAQLFADTPGAYVGMVTQFRIINTGAGTLTLTADGGATVTITGTATVAQNVWRDYTLTFTSATAATIQSVGSGVSP